MKSLQLFKRSILMPYKLKEICAEAASGSATLLRNNKSLKYRPCRSPSPFCLRPAHWFCRLNPETLITHHLKMHYVFFFVALNTVVWPSAFELSSAKYWPFCSGFNVFTSYVSVKMRTHHSVKKTIPVNLDRLTIEHQRLSSWIKELVHLRRMTWNGSV